MPTTSDSRTVYILDGVRTVFGRRHGSLKRQTVVDLSVTVVEELLKRTKVSASIIDEVILGCAVEAGVGQNPARQVALQAGLKITTTGVTINTVCGSGLNAVMLGAQNIMLGSSQVVIAGGADSASHSPILFPSSVEKPDKDDFQDSLIGDGLTCAITHQKMGVLMEESAQKYKISRQRQDAFALESHRRAYQSYQKRLDIGAVIPVASTKSKTIDLDECVRKNLSEDALAALPSAFVRSGTLTAGNSSAACDGAAAVILAGAEMVRKYRWKPAAKILGFVHIAVDPQQTFEAPAEAIKACLRQTGLSLNSIDAFEISEAFAAEMVLVQDQLKIPSEKLNVWGGDLAVGHPLGAAGARTLVSLIKILEDRRLKRGLCAVAYGGGGAVAMIVENCCLDAPLFAKK